MSRVVDANLKTINRITNKIVFSWFQEYLHQFYSDVGTSNKTQRRLIRSNFTEDLETMQDFFGLEVRPDWDRFL